MNNFCWVLRYYHLLLTLPLVLGSLRSQPPTALLSQADSLAQTQPARAAAIYDSVRRVGYVAPELYLAQGNAYLAAGDPGRAVLAYERGLRLRPGHSALTNNLRFAETKLKTVLPDLPGFFLADWWRWLGSRVGVGSAQGVAIFFWWLAIGLFGWWWLRRASLSDRLRFAILPAAGLAFGLAVLFLLLGFSRAAELDRRDRAVLVVSSATLRVAPGPEATVEQTVSAGQRLRIVDEFNDKYLKVVLRNGKRGWLDKEALEVI